MIPVTSKGRDPQAALPTQGDSAKGMLDPWQHHERINA